MVSDVEASFLANCRPRAVSGRLLISYHLPDLERGVGAVELVAIFRLSKRPISSAMVVAQILLSSASEALEPSSPSRIIGFSTLC